MELNEFKILQRKTSTGDHSVTITSTCVCTRAREVSTSITTGGKNGLVCPETVKGTILHVQRNNTNTLSILHDEVESEVFDEEVRVVSERLAVECVQDGVAGTVSDGGAAIGLAALAILERLPTESMLVDLALLGSRERNTEMFKLK